MLSKSCIIKLISETPKKPGVYQYYNKERQLLYVGKAKNLNNRVRSYFNKNNSPKTTPITVPKKPIKKPFIMKIFSN